ncbi:hypothetical protein FHX42_001947 [Saccharopolyspora lacisalsi]|uniref:Cytochrome P450 n=1 Tax=Halosaccharopolyspora lacisalsi TaxID=1000566 RepID=A0A839DUK9_9PSEU|nr:cytochrome P450 [Halosaccharopolyspora lacisalsi]MBA8824600.1 hypothetical protein [Halosaccharopolyspora lacisalsi]
MPTAAEELLRFDPPPQLAIRRFAVADVDIGGTTVPAGDTVMLSLASAHRDPDRFTDPDALDLTRDPNPHLGFGHGPLFCLGVGLARMEAETGIETLLRRFPDLTLDVPANDLRRRPSFRNRGLCELPSSSERGFSTKSREPRVRLVSPRKPAAREAANPRPSERHLGGLNPSELAQEQQHTNQLRGGRPR